MTSSEIATVVATRIDGQARAGIDGGSYRARVWVPEHDGTQPRVYVTYRTHKTVECGYFAVEADGRIDPREMRRDQIELLKLAQIDLSARTVAE